jgi:hypothetical protein
MLAVGIGYKLHRVTPQEPIVSISTASFQNWLLTLDQEFAPKGVTFDGNRLFLAEGEVEIRPGVKVPSVILHHPYSLGNTAKIYVINRDKLVGFKLEDLLPKAPDAKEKANQTGAFPLISYQQFDDANGNAVSYLVIYEGESLDAFLIHNDV